MLGAQDAASVPEERAGAVRLANQGRYLQAEAILKSLTQRDPKDVDSELALAQVYYRFGYFDSSLSALSRVLELRADDRLARVLKAVCLFKVGSDGEAVKLTKQLLAETPPPNDIDLTLTYAQYLFEHGDLDGALSEARNASTFAPTHPIGYFWVARILLQKGQLNEAEQAAEKSVQLAPQLPFARNLLVRIYRLEGRNSDAERQAEWLRGYEARKASP
jgi:Flp pilus assembly protein TadD